MKELRRGLYSILTCGAVFAPSALAQEDGGTNNDIDFGLEEIIVSAERREDTLQSTPISIVALNQGALEKAGVEDIESLQNAIPNLTISGGTGGKETSNFSIRGIGSSVVSRVTGDRGVGLYIDDVYYPRTHGSLLSILDVERIEVLRGPQGTLFGKNNTGGAIRYITKRPEDEFSGYVKVSVGEDDLRNVTALVNAPISEKFAVRAQYSDLHREGWVKRGDTRLGGNDDSIFRIVSRFEASDALTVDLGYTNVNATNDGPAIDTIEFDQPGTNFVMSRRLNDALIAFGESPLVDNDPRMVLDDYTIHDYCLLDGDGNPYTDTGGRTTLDYGPLGIEQSAPGCAAPVEVDNNMVFADINYSLTDDISLRLLTGYTTVENNSVRQWAYSGTWASISYVDSETFSQEVQLSGTGDNFTWVLGGIVSKDEAYQSYINYWLNPNQDDFLVDAGFKRIFDIETTTMGAFAQGTYDFSDRWSFTGGVRYSNDEKDFIYQRHNHFQGNPLTNEDEWSSVDYRLSLEFNISEDVMVYGTYSTAYRAGGFNDGASNSLDVNGNGIADPGENNGGILPYDPEEVKSIELGLRSEWNNQVRFNATAFSMDYNEMQIATSDRSTVPITPLIANVGSARITGFESELLWSMSNNFTLNASLGSLFDIELGTFNDPTGGEIPATTLPNAPELSYNIGLQYETELGSSSSIGASLNYSYTDGYSVQLDPTDRDRVDSRGIINARADYHLRDDEWTLSLVCSNCSDQSFSYGGGDRSGFWDHVVAYRAAPRTIQAQARYRF